MASLNDVCPFIVTSWLFNGAKENQLFYEVLDLLFQPRAAGRILGGRLFDTHHLLSSELHSARVQERRLKRIHKRNTWIVGTCLLQKQDEAQVTCRVRHLVWLEVEQNQALTVFSLAQSEWVVNKEFAITRAFPKSGRSL
jgi:hypothetical protein